MGRAGTETHVVDGNDGDARLSLLGGFRLECRGRAVSPPVSAQRVVALLGLHMRPVSRGYVAGTLWLDSSEEHAAASLRSALWRLRRTAPDLVEVENGSIGLGPGVAVDVRTMVDCTRRLHDPACLGVEDQVDERDFCDDLLPDWYDDWVLLERERLRQLRLGALEALAERRIAAGRTAAAVQAAMAAVQCEVLRESAHRVLIRAHIADGNYGEALRQFRLYTRILDEELGLEPSALLLDLVHPLLPEARPDVGPAPPL